LLFGQFLAAHGSRLHEPIAKILSMGGHWILRREEILLHWTVMTCVVDIALFELPSYGDAGGEDGSVKALPPQDLLPHTRRDWQLP
jgi:hypothetical protein